MNQSWNDIKAHYPNEYVVLANPETTSNAPVDLLAGEVIAHGPVLDDILNQHDLSSITNYAIRYTGNLGNAIGERGMLRVIEHA